VTKQGTLAVLCGCHFLISKWFSQFQGQIYDSGYCHDTWCYNDNRVLQETAAGLILQFDFLFSVLTHNKYQRTLKEDWLQKAHV